MHGLYFVCDTRKNGKIFRNGILQIGKHFLRRGERQHERLLGEGERRILIENDLHFGTLVRKLLC